MDNNEVRGILCFRRKVDCWVCPECDAENVLNEEYCTVCGFQRPHSPKVLEKWQEPVYRPVKPPNIKFPPIDDTPVPQEHKNTSPAGAIFAVAVIILFIVILVNAANAESLPECDKAQPIQQEYTVEAAQNVDDCDIQNDITENTASSVTEE